MNHINEIKITAFRGICDLELSDLSQINIIAGDNNCGKTSILEAIDCFEQPENMGKWSSLTRRINTPARYNDMTLYEGISDLFNINSENKSVQCMLKTEKEAYTLVAKASESIEEMTEKTYAKKIGLKYLNENSEELEQETREVAKMKFEVSLNGEIILNEDIYEGQRNALNSRVTISDDSGKIVYISPFRHVTGSVFLNDILNSPELYEEMLSVLKEYDNDIISINYDNESGYIRGTYKILSKAHKKALPLNVYGDGMKKAILLMSAVVKAKNGILLLDEFETAIHTSAMENTFKWILKTCKKLNVQVFMTSHSIEAISKVLKCCPDMEKDIRMITLADTKNGIKARNVNGSKAIKLMDVYGLELR